MATGGAIAAWSSRLPEIRASADGSGRDTLNTRVDKPIIADIVAYRFRDRRCPTAGIVEESAVLERATETL